MGHSETSEAPWNNQMQANGSSKRALGPKAKALIEFTKKFETYFLGRKELIRF